MSGILIGLAGDAGAGKDTVADRIRYICNREHYPGVFVFALADKMKESICAFLGITLDELNVWKRDDTMKLAILHEPNHLHMPPTVRCSWTFREVMERFGTEGHRDIFGEDFWLDIVLPLMYDRHHQYVTVVTDVRRLNEAERVRDLGGQIWRVHGIKSFSTGHSTRKPLPDELVDVEIDNATRDDDYQQLDATLSLLLRAKLSAYV